MQDEWILIKQHLNKSLLYPRGAANDASLSMLDVWYAHVDLIEADFLFFVVFGDAITTGSYKQR